MRLEIEFESDGSMGEIRLYDGSGRFVVLPVKSAVVNTGFRKIRPLCWDPLVERYEPDRYSIEVEGEEGEEEFRLMFTAGHIDIDERSLLAGTRTLTGGA